MTSTTTAYTTTHSTGGRSAPLETVTVLPDRSRTEADLATMLDGQLNAAFIADFLSAALMHEQCGRHLYRAVSGQTFNPVLRSRYEQFGAETEEHVEILHELVRSIGGDPGYVSPAARATEKVDSGTLEATYIVDGSVDLITKELLMLDAVVLAETVDRGNWQLIGQLAGFVGNRHERTAFENAVAKVGPQEDEHLRWATQTRMRLVSVLATSPELAGVSASTEDAASRIAALLAEEG